MGRFILLSLATLFTILFGLCDLFYCLKLDFVSCGGKVLELRLFGCLNDTAPCVMSRGIKGRLEVDFEAPFDSDYVYADVSQKISAFIPFPVSVPLPIVDRDACTNHGLTCPIEKGKKYNYFYDFNVNPRIPNIKGDYTLTLSTYWGHTVGCVNIPMQLAENESTVKRFDDYQTDENEIDYQPISQQKSVPGHSLIVSIESNRPEDH